jgi:hypothetical protein
MLRQFSKLSELYMSDRRGVRLVVLKYFFFTLFSFPFNWPEKWPMKNVIFIFSLDRNAKSEQICKNWRKKTEDNLSV